MDFRKTFDQIPEQFDAYRPRYCTELFEKLRTVCKLDFNKKVLEIGPGTGQATEPILRTGCDYTAIELGKNFTEFLRRKDERSANEDLYVKMQEVYKKYFRVRQNYNCKFFYENETNYGNVNYCYYEWKKERTLTAEEYISYISTHCAHITLEAPYKSEFYSGIGKAVEANNNQITIKDTIPLYLVQKPL